MSKRDEVYGADAHDELTLAVAKAIHESQMEAEGTETTWEGLELRIQHAGYVWARSWHKRMMESAAAAIAAYEEWHSTAQAPIDEKHGERIDAREREIYEAGYDAAMDKMWRERE